MNPTPAIDMVMRTTVENGLVFERDVALTMAGGTVLRAHAFRPEAPGRYSVVMAMGVPTARTCISRTPFRIGRA